MHKSGSLSRGLEAFLGLPVYDLVTHMGASLFKPVRASEGAARMLDRSALTLAHDNQLTSQC